MGSGQGKNCCHQRAGQEKWDAGKPTFFMNVLYALRSIHGMFISHVENFNRQPQKYADIMKQSLLYMAVEIWIFLLQCTPPTTSPLHCFDSCRTGFGIEKNGHKGYAQFCGTTAT